MTSVTDIFSVFGGPAAVAKILRVRPSTASEMKRRGSIPAEYWQELIAAARRSGLREITADALVGAHGRPAGHGQDTGTAGAAVTKVMHELPAGHFSRFYHLARPHFDSAREVREHVAALRDEWARR